MKSGPIALRWALDVSGSINDGIRYEELLEHSSELDVIGMPIRVLELRRLVELKRALGRTKDVAVLPVLEATLREQEKDNSK
jgi:hypothetical protein